MAIDGQPPMMGDMSQAAQQVQAQAQQPQMMAPPPAPTDPADEEKNYTDWALDQANLAKGLKDKTDKDGNKVLEKMAAVVMEGYEADERSREGWMKKNKKWLELALLLAEDKSFPWPRAANIKYPLVATAAMQFSARAYPSLVPSDGAVVKARVSDPTGELQEKAIRVARHMSYQVMECIPKWEESMDKLLMTLAISGVAFKKTYYDSTKEVHQSHIVYPENLCVNYWAKDLESAYRKTEILRYTNNELREKVLNNEEYLDLEYGDSEDGEEQKTPVSTDNNAPVKDKSTPHTILACHTFWDLDEDNYEEPYIIYIHKETKQVVKITARWDSDGVKKNDEDKIRRIDPVETFTSFTFVPNPDGSIYGCGFGMLLSSLNNGANTLINQLIDAGTMSNLQAGFIGRNLRMKEGQVALRPGEWKVVNASGEDLQKSVYPIPAREPSAVLMNLLQMLITSGNQLASIAEIMVGKMPGQNTPATTTQETVKQGMAVFTAVYKRVYRSLEEEFKKLFRLNRLNPEVLAEESKVSGMQIAESDYNGTKKLIIPGADPTGDSATVKQQKIQAVGQLLQIGTINGMEYTKRTLDAYEIPNPEGLLAQPQPPAPDPRAQTEQVKQQTMQMKAQIDQQTAQADIANKQRLLELQIAQKQLEANHKRQMAALELHNASQAAKLDLVLKTINMHHEARSGALQVEREDQQAQHEMIRADQLHNQKMKQVQQATQQRQAAKPKAKGKAK